MADLDEVAAFTRAVGHVLRTVRQQRNWTLAETGARVGLSVSVLCRVELGERPLDMRRLVALCTALGVAPAVVIATAQDDAFPLGWLDQQDKPRSKHNTSNERPSG
jgi:transcriptional regulator with XRE-family HTH domain